MTNQSASLAHRFVNATGRLLIHSIPKNRYGDHFFSFLKFISRHKRLPTNKMLFNDVLYRIKTTNEILDPMRVFVTDKEFLKIYVKAAVGDQYNVPTIDVIRSAAAIDHYSFPADCCIKPTHACKRVILRTNNSPIDRDKMKNWLKLNYYNYLREANYKMLKPKIIIEPLISNSTNVDDYKIYCYKGMPKLIQVDADRHGDHRRKFFDTKWRELCFSMNYPRSEKSFPKPEVLNEACEVATALSKAFVFIRVDLYINGNEIRVGELTNISGNAGGRFSPRAGEREASRLIFGEE